MGGASEHLIHLARFLKTIRDARLTLNLKKCRWAQNRVKFCGEILGYGQRFADPEKVKVVHEMKIPQTKTESRRILGYLFVDTSNFAYSAVLTQTNVDGVSVSVAFSSMKLTDTQQKWPTIEREAYAALMALNKYRSWLFGPKVTVHSDHNPLLYVTESAPKSAKLMRWFARVSRYF